jgi:uncharacterized ion transporter superfamily protein YfcC
VSGPAAEAKKVNFPHSLILIVSLILVACLLSYVLPAGIYEKTPTTGIFDPASFHYIENTPVSPLTALLSIQQGIVRSATIISLLLSIGGATAVILSVGAIESLINYAIKRLEHRSIKILVPGIVVVMSLLGALAGNDSMMAFVTVGVIIASRLKLDRIIAVALFYLSYITGQAAGPTTVICLTMQTLSGVPPVSGFGVRIAIWALLTTTNAIYTTRYALRISRDPSRSIMGHVTHTATSEEDIALVQNARLEFRAIASVVLLFGCFVLYAIGSGEWKWSFEHLVACVLTTSVIIAVLYRLSPSVGLLGVADRLLQSLGKHLVRIMGRGTDRLQLQRYPLLSLALPAGALRTCFFKITPADQQVYAPASQGVLPVDQPAAVDDAL